MIVKVNKINSHNGLPSYYKLLPLYRRRPNNRRKNILPGESGKNSSKELDPETGFYYYGARYLDPRTSRWLSGDPAIGEYLPQAPVNDEAKKGNGNLPGQGGVFNLVSLHVYHYAGNNPVKYVDPDGRILRIQFGGSAKAKIMLLGLELAVATPSPKQLSPIMQNFMNFLQDQGVRRTTDTDPYHAEKIADSWENLPDEVKSYQSDTAWGKISSGIGNHPGRQLRLPDGYHISEEFQKNEDGKYVRDENGNKILLGVYVHHDYFDATKSIVDNINHGIGEAQLPSPSLHNDNPDW